MFLQTEKHTHICTNHPFILHPSVVRLSRQQVRNGNPDTPLPKDSLLPHGVPQGIECSRKRHSETVLNHRIASAESFRCRGAESLLG